MDAISLARHFDGTYELNLSRPWNSWIGSTQPKSLPQSVREGDGPSQPGTSRLEGVLRNPNYAHLQPWVPVRDTAPCHARPDLVQRCSIYSVQILLVRGDLPFAARPVLYALVRGLGRGSQCHRIEVEHGSAMERDRRV